MPIITERVKARRAEILARPDTDPILSYEFMSADADVSMATFKRSILPLLEITEISDNRRGARRSVWEAYKKTRTRAPRTETA